MRRFLVLLMVLSILLVPTLAQAEKPIRLYVGNTEVVADVPPVLEGGRTLVPLRALTEALGFTVAWDGATETATLTKDRLTIALTVGKQEALVNGKPVQLDVPPVTRNGRVLIPVRFVAEQLGAKVSWDAENQVVSVQTPAGVTPGQRPAPKPSTDPAALALLEKAEGYKDVKATGDFTITINTAQAPIQFKMGTESWTKGEEMLMLNSVNLFGVEQKSGTAVYQSTFWLLGPDGVWTQLSGPATRDITQNPAAFAQLSDEVLANALVTMADQSYEGQTMAVLTISMNLADLGRVIGEEMPGAFMGDLSIRYWLDKETGMPHHMELTMTMESAEPSMTMSGILFFELLEGPIPFPATITQ